MKMVKNKGTPDVTRTSGGEKEGSSHPRGGNTARKVGFKLGKKP